MNVSFDVHYMVCTVHEMFNNVKWLRITENAVVFEDSHGLSHRYELKKITKFTVD